MQSVQYFAGRIGWLDTSNKKCMKNRGWSCFCRHCSFTQAFLSVTNKQEIYRFASIVLLNPMVIAQSAERLMRIVLGERKVCC